MRTTTGRALPLAATAALLTLGTVVSPVAAQATTTAEAAGASAAGVSAAGAGQPKNGSWADTAYRGHVHVVPATADSDSTTLRGVVFDDRDRDSVQDKGERGIPGVTVSNGRDVVTTDAKGAYEIEAFDNMTVFVTQPRGFQVPVDEDNVAQFFYNHLPEGSPELAYGGIDPTGPLPEAVNFPMAKSTATQSQEQHCLIGADVQTYTPEEAEYARNGVFSDLAERTDYEGCGALFIGDVVGDDLDMFDHTRDLTGMLNGPARFLPGNHDLDFDALDGEHEFDTFRSQFGPEYYSYDAGKAHVIAMSNIVYPTQIPAAKGDYTYGLGEQQLEWLRQDVANAPQNATIVLAGHSPLLEFFYSDSHTHQDLREIYDILEGREVVSLGGHTHMSENLRAGDLMDGWRDELGEDGLPFTHLTVPAVSGHWYSGRELEDGYVTSVQRDGTPPGTVTLDFHGNSVKERFVMQGDDGSTQMALGLNSPSYRAWYEENADNHGSAPALENASAIPVADLGDTWLTTNFWMGSTGSTVEVSIDGAGATEAVRTQQLNGETVNVGVEYSDPVAIQEQFTGGGGLADRSMHLWRLDLPTDLAVGPHTAEVTATDVYGREFVQTLEFEVTE